MRQLASIQTISNLEPIENADAIERATVLGWHLVVKKGEFKVGDKCVFFEVDSLLPTVPQFEFLAKEGTKTILGDDKKMHTGYRLKTVRLRGQISQGLALPVSSFPELHNVKESDNVTEKLGVVKYERFTENTNKGSSRKPVVFPAWMPTKVGMWIKRVFPDLAVKFWGKSLKAFPSYIPKTDETRLQSVPNVLSRHSDKTFYVTEKLDGSSVTIFNKGGEIGVCSRNIWYPKTEDNQFWKAVKDLGLDIKMLNYENIAIQGELVGEAIQGNKLLIKGKKIYFFNAFDIKQGKYLSFERFTQLCADLGVETVPILDTNFKLKTTVDEMVEYATIKSKENKDVWAEGVVVRPLEEENDQELGRLTFKVINPEFLIKYNE